MIPRAWPPEDGSGHRSVVVCGEHLHPIPCFECDKQAKRAACIDAVLRCRWTYYVLAAVAVIVGAALGWLTGK